MWKKIVIAMMAAVVLIALAAGGVALAAGSLPAQAPQTPVIDRLKNALAARRGAGKLAQAAAKVKAAGQIAQVVSVNGDEVTLKGLKDQQRTVRLDAQTVYITAEGEARSQADLQAGQWVMVAAVGQKAGQKKAAPGSGPQATAPLTGTATAGVTPRQANARLVTFLPDGWQPNDWLGARLQGHVSAVDAGQNTLTVLAGKQERVVQITADTHFLGSVQSLAGVKVGMAVSVGASQKADGGLTAAAVFARSPLLRLAGKVTQVDTGAGRLTLQLPGGEAKTVQVNAATQFRSPSGAVTGLAGLQAEMRVVVIGKQQADGTALAAAIVASGKEALPQADLRISGRVLQIQGSSLLVQARTGEQFSVQVTADTQFRSPGNRIVGLDQIQAGMVVVAGVQASSGGQYQAVYLLMGQGKANRK